MADGAIGAIERGERVGILLLAGELITFSAILGEGPHQAPLVVGVLEAVQKHMVDGAAVAHAIAGAGAVEEVGRVAHALHAAGDDDVGRARAQEVVRDHRRLHARAAHLVDRGRASRERQSGPDRRLTRRGLALARRQYAAHQDFVDAVGRDPRPLDRGPDRARAKSGRADVLQVAEKAAHRRARRADDDDRVLSAHDVCSVPFASRTLARWRSRRKLGSGRSFAPVAMEVRVDDDVEFLDLRSNPYRLRFRPRTETPTLDSYVIRGDPKSGRPFPPSDLKPNRVAFIGVSRNGAIDCAPMSWAPARSYEHRGSAPGHSPKRAAIRSGRLGAARNRQWVACPCPAVARGRVASGLLACERWRIC